MPAWSYDELLYTAYSARKDGWRIVGTQENGSLEITCTSATELYRHTMGIQIAFGVAATWLRCGAPTVKVAPQAYKRFLAATPATKPILPWPAWLIRVPKSEHAPTFINRAGKPDPVRLVLCFGDFKYARITYLALASQVEYLECGAPLEALRDNAQAEIQDLFGSESDPIVTHDRQSKGQIGRIILGTCSGLFGVYDIDRVGPERAAEIRGRLPAGDYELK